MNNGFFHYHLSKILRELSSSDIELTLENIPRIIHQTNFTTRSNNFPDECPYYPNKKPCLSTVYELNCFLCACPEYKSEIKEGGCNQNSRAGFWYHNKKLEKGRIWDCSFCSYPHDPKTVEEFIKNNIDELKHISEQQIVFKS